MPFRQTHKWSDYNIANVIGNYLHWQSKRQQFCFTKDAVNDYFNIQQTCSICPWHLTRKQLLSGAVNPGRQDFHGFVRWVWHSQISCHYSTAGGSMPSSWVTCVRCSHLTCVPVCCQGLTFNWRMTYRPNHLFVD